MNTETSIDERLRSLAAMVLGAEADEISDDSSPDTLLAWSSVRHLSLVAAVEEEFAIRLSMADIHAAQRFGELRRIVAEAVERSRRA